MQLMVYIYKKAIGERNYYYLRVSSRKGDKTYTKDIAYLGDSIEEVRRKIARLPEKDVRTAHRTIKHFIESNTFLDQAHKLKL